MSDLFFREIFKLLELKYDVVASKSKKEFSIKIKLKLDKNLSSGSCQKLNNHKRLD